MILACIKCAGEGSLYTSRYGGNDPDVWPAGECDACGGSGNATCDARGCAAPAADFDEDGRALCEECLSEWAVNYGSDEQ